MIKQPKIHNKTLWKGAYSMDPLGVIIHNDYGRMNALEYEGWLRRSRVPKPDLGFAHYYIDRNTIARYVPTDKSAWHAGDGGKGVGNRRYIGYEVVQSLGPQYGEITQAQFIENENMTLRQAAEDLQFYKLKPNRTTVKLHNQFASTSCPHLSQSIHGRGVKVQDYFIGRIKYYISLGKTVKEMIDNENKGKKVNNKAPSSKPVNQTGKKSNETVAQEVVDGKWGNNPKRRESLERAGYNYHAVQTIVNGILTGGNHKKGKSINQLANEVIKGQWGVNPRRKQLLERAGYNYSAVQREVNKILNTSSGKSIDTLAKEVIDGKWGNNPARKRNLQAAGYDYDKIQKKVNQLL